MAVSAQVGIGLAVRSLIDVRVDSRAVARLEDHRARGPRAGGRDDQLQPRPLVPFGRHHSNGGGAGLIDQFDAAAHRRRLPARAGGGMKGHRTERRPLGHQIPGHRRQRPAAERRQQQTEPEDGDDECSCCHAPAPFLFRFFALTQTSRSL